MAKIAVVEDNAAVRQELCGFIAQYAQESGQLLEVTPFADGSQIVEPYRPGFDIIFLHHPARRQRLSDKCQESFRHAGR